MAQCSQECRQESPLQRVTSYQMRQISGESLILNRLSKMSQKLKEIQLLSEIDIFSQQIQLNINGKEIYTTLFGGFVGIFIMFVSLFFTYQTQYRKFTAAYDPIFMYQILEDDGPTQTLFDNYDSFFDITFLVKGKQSPQVLDLLEIYVYQVTDQGATQLQVSTDGCHNGLLCLKNTDQNSQAMIFGSSAPNSSFASIQLEIFFCSFNDSTYFDNDTNISRCEEASMADMELIVYNYAPDTGIVKPKMTKLKPTQGFDSQVFVNRAQYTTNTPLFGAIANIFSYVITYYNVKETLTFSRPLVQTIPNRPASITTTVLFTSSGVTQILNQQFLDITVPILFFLSLIQTLGFFTYYLATYQYNMNCMFLEIADQLVYIEDHANHRNEQFQSGWQTFIACLVYKNYITRFFDQILLLIKHKTVEEYMTDKMKKTIEMIRYGEQQMNRKEFFEGLQRISAEESDELHKIVVDDQIVKPADEEEEDEEQIEYFEGEPLKAEAFRQLCQEHRFLSAKRKNYLYGVLQDNSRNQFLRNQTHSLFQNYIQRVKLQRKEIPIEESIILRSKQQNSSLQNSTYNFNVRTAVRDTSKKQRNARPTNEQSNGQEFLKSFRFAFND